MAKRDKTPEPEQGPTDLNPQFAAAAPGAMNPILAMRNQLEAQMPVRIPMTVSADGVQITFMVELDNYVATSDGPAPQHNGTWRWVTE